jgi:Xaa-Pro dipeptidase
LTSRRDLLKFAALGVPALGLASGATAAASAVSDDATSSLPPPISNAEREARIARAQELMQQQGVAGIVIEAGTSMLYFSALAWRQASRVTALVIPASGDPVIVAPDFEEGKLRELMVMEMEVRTWQEHESPYRLIAGVLDDRNVQGPIGLERTARFFVAEGLRADAPNREIVSASPIVSALRQIKSAREIELMQAANDITMAAYRDIYPQIETGMTGSEVAALMTAATRARGGRPVFTLALIGEASERLSARLKGSLHASGG